MLLYIQKRNGAIVPFDKQRIIDAINKAFISIDGCICKDNTPSDIADKIKYSVKEGNISSVEEIQDIIECYLMDTERKDVAKAYIKYRYKQAAARNGQDDFMKALSEKINALDIENQNANVDERSFGGRVGAASDLQMKKYALNYCISNMARRNHEDNIIYIHDLSTYAVGSHNCLSVPFDDLLAKGFNTRQTDVRPAGSVNTAFQLVAVIFQLQSLQQFGGVSATHLDWTMVPYVRKSFYKHFTDGMNYCENLEFNGLNDITNRAIDDPDGFYIQFPKAYKYAMDMTKKEIHQAVEGLYHNLNTLQSRSGNQLNRVAG